MSAAVIESALPVLNRPTWAQPASGLYVASRAGEFVGYIDTTADGHYIAFDGRSTPVGRYVVLAEAKRAVLTAGGPRRVPLYGLERRFHAAAAATGAVAAVLLATAGTVVPYL